nr:MAG TPA: PROTEIN/RNA Complex, archaeal, ribosomal, 50S, protein.0A [Caudoviricetes sp.]
MRRKISYPSADGKALTNYCHNCGAKMEGEGDAK